MNEKQFSSKDFPKTLARLKAHIPDRLIHKQVVNDSAHDSFSRERKHPVHIVNLPSRHISITVGILALGQKTNRHRHTYETILYVLEGNGWTEIEDQVLHWQAGDAVLIPQWAWHRHGNDTEDVVKYVACENAPHLQNMGLAIRQEKEGENG